MSNLNNDEHLFIEDIDSSVEGGANNHNDGAEAIEESPLVDLRTGAPIRLGVSTGGAGGINHQAMLRQQAHPAPGIHPRPNRGNDSNRNNISNNVINPGPMRPPNNNVDPAMAAPPPNRNNNNNSNQDLHRDPSIQRHAPEQALSMESSASVASESSTTSSGWTNVEINGGTPPSARSLHAAALLNGNMLVFGGYDGIQRVNTFHAFSFAEKRWSPVLPSANSSPPPSPRDRHVALAFGNSFYVHGGFDGTSRVSDFWQFDFSSMAWREVVVRGGRAPSPRHSHAAVVYRQSLYIFGGESILRYICKEKLLQCK